MPKKQKRSNNFMDDLNERIKDPRVRKSFEEGLDELRIGAKLAKLREERKLSQSQLAGKMNTSQAIISRIENGHDFKLSTLLRYLDVLGHGLEIVPKN